MARKQKLDKKNIENIYALTPMQEGMLFHYLKEPQGKFYFEQLALDITGPISADLFEQAWNAVIRGNGMLRTLFRWEKVAAPVQAVLKEHRLSPRYAVIPAGLEPGSAPWKGAVEEIKRKDGEDTFDLREVPFRVTLCRQPGESGGHHVLIISSHHILYDGWSNGIILKEFFDAYRTLSGGGSWAAPSKPLFKSFIEDIRKLDRPACDTFWRRYLSGYDSPLGFSLRGGGSPDAGGTGYRGLKLSRERLEAFSRDRKITPAALLYAAWGLLLQSYNHSRDAVFGTTVSGRSGGGSGIENCVGLFINTVPLRMGDETVRAGNISGLLSQVNQRLRDRESFENASLADIKACTSLGGDDELFDTLVVIENYPLEKSLAAGEGELVIRDYSMVERTHYDFTVIIKMFREIEVGFYFQERFFAPAAVERLARHFQRLIGAMLERPDALPGDIEFISAEEKKQILVNFNDTREEYSGGKALHICFEKQALRTPGRAALVGGWETAPRGGETASKTVELDYQRVNRYAGALAAKLAGMGVGPGVIVGLSAERSLEMVIAMLAIMKAGGAYLPVLPDYPAERKSYLLRDSGAGLLMVAAAPGEDRETAPAGWDGGILYLDQFFAPLFSGQPLPIPVPPVVAPGGDASEGLAYVIYTSGSTGKPKGVMVEHRAIVNTLLALQGAYPLTEGDTYLLKTTYAFDVSVAELFGWYLGGGRLAVLPPGAEKEPRVIIETIAAHGVTHLNFVPSMFNLFLEALDGRTVDKTTCLKYIFLAGEALPAAQVLKFRALGLDAHIRLENIYGPTEASIYGSWYSLRDWAGGGTVPIGKPLTNVQLYILDPDGRPQPVGVTGELYIAGAGLARGYLNRPVLTEAIFLDAKEKMGVHAPASGTEGPLPSRLYKSGDLARWMPDGNVEFLGRIDHQVKVRGFRIELGEIESRLAEHPAVKDVVVLALEDRTGDKQLAAYVVVTAAETAAGTGALAAQLQEHLGEKLPDYMVPGYVIPMEAFPLTTSGKIDRKSLPRPSDDVLIGKAHYVGPRNHTEVQLVAMWSGILGHGRETIGIDDNFFHLGGHSLRATGLAGRIYKTFDVEIPLGKIFDIPTIRGLSDFLARTAGTGFQAIVPVEKQPHYPVSPAQKRLFILDRMMGVGTAYNMTGLMMLEGGLDIPRLESCFKQLIQRHDSLRTTFDIIDEQPVQVIHDTAGFQVEMVPGDGSGADIDAAVRRFSRPFDLSAAPLMRVGLLRLEERRHLLMLEMHHIISDGTSLEITTRDFTALFSDTPLEPLKLQYKDYSHWQNSEAYRGALSRQGEYWSGKFAGEVPLLSLPLDFPRREEQVFDGKTLRFQVPAPMTSKLNAFSLNQNVTLSMTLLAAFNLLLAKLSNQEALVVGTPVAGRRHPDLEPLIGMFVNTLGLYNEPRPELSFREFLQDVKKGALEAFENQEYPFEDLVDLLEIERDVSRNPLFDVMFAFQNMDGRTIRLGELEVTPYTHDRTTAKFDLYLEGAETGDTLSFSLEYCTALFREETAGRFVDYFNRVLETLLATPDIPLSDIQLMSGGEKQAVLELSRGTADPAGRDETIHFMFEENLPAHAAKPALVYQNREMTYAELNSRANQLARVLRGRGVTADTVVAVMVERSFEMIIGMLAILKAGGAYLPIDAEYPEQRKQVMLQDGNIKVLLVSNVTAETLPPVPEHVHIVNIQKPTLYTGDDSNLPYQSKGGDLLYVIYTSGSTGKPKGVMLEHRNLTNLLRFQYRHTSIDFRSVLQFTTISFDVSFQEIFSTLVAGGTLYLIDEELRKNVPELFRFVGEKAISTLFLPTSFLKFVLNEKEYVDRLPGTVNHIVVAGEQLVVNDLCRGYLNRHNVLLHNHYGPSEAHVVTALTLSPGDVVPDRPSIGRPVSNTGIYIVDKGLHLLPRGVVGELLISGVQVGRGYMGGEELTAEKFIANPITPEERLYRTGDLSRWLPDGSVEFLGRADHQVKIRGFRIELGEIESQLLNHKMVKEAAVLDFQPAAGERALCAYVVPADPAALDEAETRGRLIRELRDGLGDELPAYMVPSAFMVIETVPLTPNKKVDRRALPRPEVESLEKEHIPPRNPQEKALVELWAGLLGISPETISIGDDFFHLGGHSLKATLMVSRLHRQLNIEVPLTQVFKTPTVRGLGAFIRGAAQTAFSGIEPVGTQPHYPVSSAQKRLYLLQQMQDIGSGYNLWGVFKVVGQWDKDRMEQTFRHVIQRHDGFRTSFETIDGEPVQRIHDRVDFSIQCPDLPGEEGTAPKEDTAPDEGTAPKEDTAPDEGTAPEVLVRRFIRPFDLSRAPLLRVGIMPLPHGDEESILVVDMHHIISDGMSLGILVREFMTLYGGRELPPVRLQYKDFAHWQAKEKDGPYLGKQEAYWLERLQGEPPVLDLPLDYPRPPVQVFDGRTVEFRLGQEAAGSLADLAEIEGLTLNMVLLAGYYIFLSKLSRRYDIIVGGPVAGRRHPDLEGIIGMFVNTLAHRNHPEPQKTLRTFLQEVKENLLADFENQDYLFEDLVEKITVRRDAARNPLFDTLLVLQSFDIPAVEIPGLTLEPYPYREEGAKFDLSILADQVEGNLRFSLEYCTALFKARTIERFILYFKHILRALPGSLDRPLAEIRVTSPAEREQVLRMFNNTRRKYPENESIHRLFEARAAAVPRRPALIGLPLEDGQGEPDRTLTYEQVNLTAHELYRQLSGEGVRPGDIVGIMGDRSIEMILGIIAILKAGAVFLPIDADYPEARKRYMLTDSRVDLMLTPRRYAARASQLAGRVIEIPAPAEEPWNRPLPAGSAPLLSASVQAPDPAYIMYTSGSTGKPKGVLVLHRNVVRLVINSNFVLCGEHTRTLQTGAPVFDAVTFEIWGPLLNGGQLVLAPKDVILDAGRLAPALKKHQVNTLWLSAPLFNQLMQQDIEMFEPLRDLVVGGDVLSPEHINKVRQRFPGLRIVNGYGPTENTTFSNTHAIDSEYIHNIPIGRPIANSTAYIVDPHNALLPTGVPGELLVGGDGVARGYLNDPELCSQKFIPLSAIPDFSRSAPPAVERPEGRLYRTGDLARWLPGGIVEFLGRIDFQVKIRGFRVELGEIENQLLNCTGITGALVVVKETPGREKFLCAYIVSRDDVQVREIKTALARKLPDYMVPSYFVPLESMPLNPNGKIDRKALPEPEIGAEEEYTAPTDAIETAMAAIWAEVLGVETTHIGIDSDFFDLGGHSLKAARLIARVDKQLQVKLPLAEIFTSPTVRALAAYVRDAVKESYTPIPRAPESDIYPVSSAQERLFVLQRMDEQGIFYNMPALLSAEGQLDKEKLEGAFRGLIRRHPILRTSFEMQGSRPIQRVHENVNFVVSYQTLGADQTAAEAVKAFVRPFDLAVPPLMRIGLLKPRDDYHLMMIDMHHIIGDGASMAIIMQEITALYAGQELAPPVIRYHDYASWQAREGAGETMRKQQEYWSGKLQGDIPRLDLPTDFPRPAAPTFEGDSVQFELDAALTAGLNRLAREEDVTLYMILVAVLNIVFAKLTAKEDVLIGSVMAGRNHPDLQEVIGMFVNTLVLRNQPVSTKTFREFLSDVKQGTLEAFANQDYPFEKLVEQLGGGGNTMQTPFFDVMFSMDSLELRTLEIPGLVFRPYPQESGSAKFDLTIMVHHSSETVIFTMEYRTKLFKKEKIERYEKYIREIMTACLENRDSKLGDITISTDLAKAKVVEMEMGFNF